MAKRGAERDLNKDNAEEEEEEEVEDVSLPFILSIGVKLMQVARTERYSPCSYYWTTVSLISDS
jgi:hypothetical protein